VVGDEILVGNAPRGIALTPAGDRAYVASVIDDLVSVFDPTTRTLLGDIPLGKGPLDVATHPDGETVYVTNGNALSLIDVRTGRVRQSFRLGNSPRNVAVAPNGQRVYATNGDTLFVIDAATNVIDSGRALESPRDLAVTPDSRQVYVVAANAVAVTDAEGHILQTGIIVGEAPAGMAIAALPGPCWATAEPPPCSGDCAGDGQTTIDDLVTLIGVALGTGPVAACAAGDLNGDAEITVDEVVTAVAAALGGCGG
jgi:YVTN family beta-propeller protein